ncbi:MAG: hypothetical protein R3212_13575, partial [Xanthomonadales bacterium]|nr:hypothetical protein [Xanthomonadales bacterium]
MNRQLPCLAAALLLALHCGSIAAQDVADGHDTGSPQLVSLAEAFNDWLASNRPVTPHAVLRRSRPAGWDPDWSQSAIQKRKTEYLQFQGRQKAISTLGFDTADRIDAAILGANMARVHWSLEVLDRPRRDPGFYLDQSLGSLFEVLVRAPEPGASDIEELIRRLHRFPPLINAAKLQLEEVVGALAEETIARIDDVDARADAFDTALSPYVSDHLRYDFNVGMRAMRQSLTTYKDWLTLSLDRFNEP